MNLISDACRDIEAVRAGRIARQHLVERMRGWRSQARLKELNALSHAGLLLNHSTGPLEAQTSLLAISRDADHFWRRLVIREQVIQRERGGEFRLSRLSRDEEMRLPISPRSIRSEPAVQIRDETSLPVEQSKGLPGLLSHRVPTHRLDETQGVLR